MEARASLSRPGVANLPSNQSPVQADAASVTSAAGPAASGCLCNCIYFSIIILIDSLHDLFIFFSQTHHLP